MGQVAKDPKATKEGLWGGESEFPKLRLNGKHQRLVDYNVEVLCQHRNKLWLSGWWSLQQVDGTRREMARNLDIHRDSSESTKVLEEVTEIIKPKFRSRAFKDHVDPSTIVLEPKLYRK
jgi:hypothetical protein